MPKKAKEIECRLHIEPGLTELIESGDDATMHYIVYALFGKPLDTLVQDIRNGRYDEATEREMQGGNG